MIREEILKKLKKLPDYGTPVNWEKLQNTSIYGLVGAFPNADAELALKELLVTYPKEITQGLQELTKSLQVEEKKLIVPEKVLAEALLPYAEVAGIEVEVTDFIHIREYPNWQFIHPVYLLNISRIMEDKPLTCPIYIGEKLIEAELGSTLGAYFKDTEIKAVLINHHFYEPSIMEQTLNRGLDLGNGFIQIVKKEECLVQKAAEESNRLREKSCGICTFCREGLYQICTTLDGMQKPGMKVEKLEIAQEIGKAMELTCMCSVGKTAAEPVLSMCQETFKNEAAAHCDRGSCPTGACKGFMNIYIDPQKCEGCGDCMDVCPKDCIEGKPRFISMIDEFECDKCGKCVSVCENNAIIVTSNRVPKLPTKPTRVGRFR